jgi:amino acid transporter
MIKTQQGESTAAPKLRRVLSAWDLIIYGIVAVTPSAPVTVFGGALVRSKGHAIDTILLAMVAMVLTAVSYGRMAALYPSAGSAYTYVGKGLNAHLGFLAGWAMLLDYLFIPLFCVIYGSLAFQRLLPAIPFFVFAAFFAGIMTFANLWGIRTTARTSEILVAAVGVVLLCFMGLAIRYVTAHEGGSGLVSTAPFYNPETFHWGLVARATSFAALTYLGFDSVTTLAEEVRNPKRSVMLATVGVCVFTGIFGGLLVYLAQLAWPDYQTFTNVETAFMDVTRRVGGEALFQAMAVLLIVANIGAGLTSQAGAARLMFGMGRDDVLPRRIFGYLDPKRNSPTINIWIIGLLAFFGSLVMRFELTAELLNFGAFLGFTGVNAAAVRQFYFGKQTDRKRSLLMDFVVPGLGFLFCLVIWVGLGTPAKIAGGIWFALGFIHLAYQTRGFRQKPAMLDFTEA